MSCREWRLLLLLLFAMLCLSRLSRADDATGVVLGGPWFLQSGATVDATASGERLSQTDYTPSGWMPAVVPGTV